MIGCLAPPRFAPAAGRFGAVSLSLSSSLLDGATAFVFFLAGGGDAESDSVLVVLRGCDASSSARTVVAAGATDASLALAGTSSSDSDSVAESAAGSTALGAELEVEAGGRGERTGLARGLDCRSTAYKEGELTVEAMSLVINLPLGMTPCASVAVAQIQPASGALGSPLRMSQMLKLNAQW